MSDGDILKALMTEFAAPGTTVGWVELKFKLAPKFGEDKLKEILDKLIEKGAMKTYEFSGTQYKSITDIPISLSGGAGGAAPAAGGEQLAMLSKLVVALANASDDPAVKDLLSQYTSKFS